MPFPEHSGEGLKTRIEGTSAVIRYRLQDCQATITGNETQQESWKLNEIGADVASCGPRPGGVDDPILTAHHGSTLH
jgi:hypothetical protein